MGFIEGLTGGVGGNTGAAGMRYQATLPDVRRAVTDQQNQEGYNLARSGLGQQQAFVDALRAQNGISNQSNVFAQQQALANQLGALSQGQGPNPAQNMLAQATGQNVANQAALMAGQRGAGANVGLLARQIANQGANIQQQSAGQAATMGAQQQLAALGQLQNQQALMGNLANQQVNQQAQALGGYNQAAQNFQGNLLNSIAQENAANVSGQNSANAANAGIAQVTARNQGQLLGGVLQGGGAAIGAMAEGGMVPQRAGPSSHIGMYFNNMADGGMVQQQQPNKVDLSTQKIDASSDDALSKGSAQMAQALIAAGGKAAAAMNQGGAVNMKTGGKVPGQAAVPGDSYHNDTVPAMLSPKEIVIPRSITMGPNAPENAARFVAAVLAKQGMKNGSK